MGFPDSVVVVGVGSMDGFQGESTFIALGVKMGRWR
jgi:hypothetical protein